MQKANPAKRILRWGVIGGGVVLLGCALYFAIFAWLLLPPITIDKRIANPDGTMDVVVATVHANATDIDGTRVYIVPHGADTGKNDLVLSADGAENISLTWDYASHLTIRGGVRRSISSRISVMPG